MQLTDETINEADEIFRQILHDAGMSDEEIDNIQPEDSHKES